MTLMRAILAALILCTALSAAQAAEPSPEMIAHGKALVDAGDCYSCHTSDPAKPFAGGVRIETPFGAINDTAHRVTLVLEAAMMREARLNFHPLVNTRTTGLASADLVRFLRATGHEPAVVAFAQRKSA